MNFTNTEFERIALGNSINFSDGHARTTNTAGQRAILERALYFYDQSITSDQIQLENTFYSDFFSLANQNTIVQNGRKFLSYSSSSAIIMAAKACKLKKWKVLLIEPCFDNIRHILQTEDVEVVAVSESKLLDPNTFLNELDGNTALWLVLPNNPTGFCLDEKIFNDLLDIIKLKSAHIIVDFCFRFFADSFYDWDQYQLLIEKDLSFICIEDTGKTWSLADMKVGITVCSENNFKMIHKLHDELLLNVSPFHLALLIQFINNSKVDGVHETIKINVEKNRALIEELINEGLLFRESIYYKNVPMELLSTNSGLSSLDFWNLLKKRGVDILPAHNYYWSGNSSNSMFRIPLSRPFEEFEKGIKIIRQLLKELSNG